MKKTGREQCDTATLWKIYTKECNVSRAKIKKLISEMTGGEVEIFVGMINGIWKHTE